MAGLGRLGIAATLVACVAGPVTAQNSAGAMVGLVRDSAGEPVPLAMIMAARAQTVADSAGRFALAGLPVGRVTVSVRRLGFEPSHLVVDLIAGRQDTLIVVLAMLPRDLPGLTTSADSRARIHLVDFYRHKESGMGRYFDRSQINAMRVSLLSDVLRRLPGVRISPDGRGRYVLRMNRSTRNCSPDFWIDNIRAPFLNVDDIPLSDIEAVEVYNGPGGLPPEYNHRFGNPSCGAVVIWTRVPG
jgi:hypothetical protein